MIILESVSEIRRVLKDTPGSIGFVPTMGALHMGHEALIKKSKIDNDVTVVSIFVNPAQFNDLKDFKSYPDTFKEDVEKLKNLGVDFIFNPKASEIYLEEDNIRVSDIIESKLIEGEKRPGHFDGVLTVVLKLFNILNPDRAYFGEKDFQQLSLVRKMTKSLFLNIEVVSVPTLRDEKGLPFSSRNQKLSSKGLKAAQEVAAIFSQSTSKKDFIDKFKNMKFSHEGIDLEYVEEQWGRILTVYKVEGVRILDNRELKHENSH